MCVMIIVVQQSRFTTRKIFTNTWKGMHKKRDVIFQYSIWLVRIFWIPAQNPHPLFTMYISSRNYRLCQRKCEPKKKKKKFEGIQKYFFTNNHINQEKTKSNLHTTLLASKIFKNLPSPITNSYVISLKMTKTNLDHHI